MSAPRLMVVEDEGIIAQDLRVSLRRLGYDVVAVVSTGQAAIDRAQTERPDLVLMDVGLPGGITGVDAARRIQEQQRIPVVFLTAHADAATIRNISAVQPAGYIVKPYHARELQRAIEQALGQPRPAANG